MKVDRMTRVLLGIVAGLLLLNLLTNGFPSKPAMAGPEAENKGRYQISAWGVQAQSTDPRSGYYVLDTATGQVVGSKVEIHSR
jgi:hypothetical protein